MTTARFFGGARPSRRANERRGPLPWMIVAFTFMFTFTGVAIAQPALPAASNDAGTERAIAQPVGGRPPAAARRATLSLDDVEIKGELVKPPLPNQTVVFRHARQALAEGRGDDVLRLWLLRNALVDRGEPALHDEEFASLVWVALGKRGLCPDGFPRDVDGAGIWPLAMHNFMLARLRKRDIDPPPGWPAFEVARQQRHVSLRDVLTLEELRHTRFTRGFCTAGYTQFAEAGGATELLWPDLDDRLVVGTMMLWLLERARATVVPEKVEHLALIDARVFDLEVALVELRARRAREQAAQVAQVASSVGLPDSAVDEIRARLSKVPPASEQGELLQRALKWSPQAWLTLSPERRLSLFSRAKDSVVFKDDIAARDRLILGVIDGLIERGAGQEIEAWIGFLDVKPDNDERSVALRAHIARGARGERLLALADDSGFSGRSIIALHRAVWFLEEGKLQDSLSSFSYALAHSDETAASTESRSLSLRWLSYVASQFETTPELVETLRALAKRRDVARILEDLLWRAALRADAKSYDVVLKHAPPGGSLERTGLLLRPLSQGNAGAFVTELTRRLQEEPQNAMLLVANLLARIESEELEVRKAHASTLRLVLDQLKRLADDESSSSHRRARQLRERALAILDGLGRGEVPKADVEHTLTPEHEAYAGSVRLAPNDPLPWPFRAPVVAAPSAFVPLVLVPIETLKGPNGARVAGWSLTE